MARKLTKEEVYEHVARLFLESYPAGAVLNDDELRDWLRLEIGIVCAPGAVAALRADLNIGARRCDFILDIADKAAGTLLVRALAPLVGPPRLIYAAKGTLSVDYVPPRRRRRLKRTPA